MWLELELADVEEITGYGDPQTWDPGTVEVLSPSSPVTSTVEGGDPAGEAEQSHPTEQGRPGLHHSQTGAGLSPGQGGAAAPGGGLQVQDIQAVVGEEVGVHPSQHQHPPLLRYTAHAPPRPGAPQVRGILQGVVGDVEDLHALHDGLAVTSNHHNPVLPDQGGTVAVSRLP